MIKNKFNINDIVELNCKSILDVTFRIVGISLDTYDSKCKKIWYNCYNEYNGHVSTICETQLIKVVESGAVE